MEIGSKSTVNHADGDFLALLTFKRHGLTIFVVSSLMESLMTLYSMGLDGQLDFDS
jgi:hypothetical protein